MVAKIIKDSLKAADGGRVEVTLQSANQTLYGTIEKTFFEDAFGDAPVNPQQQVRFTTENLSYLEHAFQKLLEDNAAELVVR